MEHPGEKGEEGESGRGGEAVEEGKQGWRGASPLCGCLGLHPAGTCTCNKAQSCPPQTLGVKGLSTNTYQSSLESSSSEVFMPPSC